MELPKKPTLAQCLKHFWLQTERDLMPTSSLDDWKIPYLELMQNLREQGYHKRLRAAQSQYNLFLSRSILYPSHEDNVQIKFKIEQDGQLILSLNDGAKYQVVHQNTFEILDVIKGLLDTLLEIPISIYDEQKLIQKYRGSITSLKYLENAPIPIKFKYRWLRTEEFYRPFWSDENWKLSIVELLQTLREKGYHKRLHAGQSLYDLILSRSIFRNLRGGKPNISIHFNRSGGMDIVYHHKDEKLEFKSDVIGVTPELEMLIEKLVQEPLS